MKRNGIHQWMSVSIMVLSLLFLFGAPAWAQVNADAGFAIDMDLSTKNYDPAGTLQDIESSLPATTGMITVGLVALNVENMKAFDTRISFDSTRMRYDAAVKDQFPTITNFLESNGGTSVFVANINPDNANEVAIAASIAGTDDTKRVTGSGLVAILYFTPLDEEANNVIGISSAEVIEVPGETSDVLPADNLEDGIVNPVACDAVASFTYTTSGLTVTIDMSASETPGGFVVNWGDGTVDDNPAVLSHTYAVADTYNVTLTANGTGGACTVDDSQDVIVVDTCDAVAALALTSTDDLTATFNTTGSSGTLSFDYGDGNTDSATTHTYGAEGTYTVTLTATGTGGCTDTATLDVTVSAPSACEAIITGPDTAVAPSTVQLSADSSVVATGDSIISYAWAITDPDGNSAGTVGGNPGNINISSIRVPDDVYSVVLTITTANGCSDESEAHVITVVEDIPTCDGISAVISATPATAAANQQIVFSGSASTPSDDATAITNYHWTFGDGAQDDAVQSTKEYIAAGTYTVTLTVTDDNDCTATDTITMTITPDGGLLGDADDNGVVDVFDALLIAQYDAGIILASQVPGFDVSDVDDNGAVDINDALGIAQYDVGLPCGCLLD